MFPSIDPEEVGNTGLLWLFLSYGFILFKASGLISEGSELLLLVPSLAGLVGGVVLPLLGAVPDGAIMLFSGLGDKEKVQETLSVGVGALAGSTIMLLTIPFGLCVLAGRVDLIKKDDGQVEANYSTKPKLTEGRSFSKSGVVLTDDIRHSVFIMMCTTVAYILIQIPAFFIHGDYDGIAKKERVYAFLALILCVERFVWYLKIRMRASKADEERFHRMEKIKDLLLEGTVSLSGALCNVIETFDNNENRLEVWQESAGYQAIDTKADRRASTHTMEYLMSVLKLPFQKYDLDKSNGLQKNELAVFLRDFKENLSHQEVDHLFEMYDKDKNGIISFDEFVEACHNLIMQSREKGHHDEEKMDIKKEFSKSARKTAFELNDEEEEVPHDLADLPPDQQQAAIKKKAFSMLALGTCLVLLFSDPMVEVLQETATRIKVPAFYVSFALSPLAANASEVLASQYYASKKTTKTISVSFSALIGAAVMNNTFCLSIFMGLIFFRGLAWQFTAETIAILSCQVFIFFMTRKSTLSAADGLIIILFFPFSIALVAVLEAYGMD